ncbi:MULTISPECIES: hypothetical protein [unclassified Cyanobium]|uniref:hypothetical protein n=1 Tax=unclassified Cyanobium TaxID=2627006 RepID=UPI0020CEB656|nr:MULTISPECIES: hypothetical protein [unclassified Cyanobium]MCP9860829.1 hypothetical protein [Cyanobium sp. Cruz-8H5]MCP9868054.1 hypothetical protein [Cyanobium sp. Cruz-8D1]
MVAALLIAMAVLLGSLAISNRSSLAELASAYQSQSREARAAADSGMTAVVSELNRPRNRRLLVNACLLNTATPAAIATDPRVKVVDGRDSGYADVRTTFLFEDKTATHPDQRIITHPDQRNNIGDGSQQRSRLIPLEPDDCPTAEHVKQGNGELILTVRGEALRGDVVVAATTLRQTLEVVPKCLDRSLRNAFGNDNRRCTLAPGFGFVAGAADDNSGDLVIKGGSYEIVNDSFEPVDPITCLASSPSGCHSSLKNTSVNVVDVQIPPPLPTDNTFCRGNSPDVHCNVAVTSDLTLATRNFASWPAPWNSICKKQDANGNTTTSSTYASVACSINSLSSSNNRTLIIDVSGASAGSSTIPVRLHFPNAGSAIALGNGTEIHQCNTQNGSAACNTTTSTTNPLKAADLALFGCAVGAPSPCGAQTVDFANGNGNSQSLFVYFPNGNVSMGGNVKISGVIWTNDFTANGNVTINIPDTDLASVCSLMKFCGEDYSDIGIDYVTRAVKRLTYS